MFNDVMIVSQVCCNCEVFSNLRVGLGFLHDGGDVVFVVRAVQQAYMHLE